jgi:hypothetical protein
MANRHQDLDATNGIHIPCSYVYADASARAAATGFTADDVGKFARQTDNGSYWQLGAVTPTWYPISPSAITGDVSITAAGVSTVTDLTITSEAQGDIIYRNATNWVRLAAGTNGHYLKTQGSGANPTWAAVSASGGLTEVRAFVADNLYQDDGVAYIPIAASWTMATVYAQVLTAPTGANILIQVEYSADQGGSWTNLGSVTITAGNKTGTASISQLLAANSMLRFDIDTVGTTLTGANLGITVKA